MFIVTSDHGFGLVFTSIEDLQNMAKNLMKIQEEFSKNRVDPPYVYTFCNEHVGQQKSAQFTLEVKHMAKSLYGGPRPEDN